MSIHMNLNATHYVMAANAHYYKVPTEERYIDRTLPHHDLIYLVEGSWSITENEQEYPLQKDDCLLLSAGRHHYTRLPCAPGTRTFCIHISGDTQAAIEQNDVIELPTLIHAHNNPKIKKYFSEIVTVYWGKGDYKEKQLSALLDLLFLELRSLTQAKQDSDLAEQAISLLTAAPHIHYTSKEMAEVLFVSTKTLDKSMVHRTGLSFHAYQKERKLEMAASLLVNEPDLQLREIANALGFYDEFHFSKSFKQKYQLSPRGYRLKHNGNESQ